MFCPRWLALTSEFVCVLPLLDGDARRTHMIYPSLGKEGPTSNGVGEIVLSCTEALVQW
jgi:hypothetical protein